MQGQKIRFKSEEGLLPVASVFPSVGSLQPRSVQISSGAYSLFICKRQRRVENAHIIVTHLETTKGERKHGLCNFWLDGKARSRKPAPPETLNTDPLSLFNADDRLLLRAWRY
jgi:hypothetical protein